jgi:hypothetical protein
MRVTVRHRGKPLRVDLAELVAGIEEEREHTENFLDRVKISLDHLAEDKRYYTKLRKAGL